MVSYREPRLYFIFSTTLFAVIGVSLIAPILPTMREELELDRAQIGLMVTFFTVPGIFLAPLAGIFADKYGRKAVLVPSLFIFGLAGSACALVNQFEFLLLLRALQGIGGSGLMALATTIIGDLYTGSDRADVLGKNASVLSVGTATYPIIGGFLAALLGWYAPFLLFFLAVPLGMLIWKFADLPSPEKSSNPIKEYFHATLLDLWNIEALLSLLVGIYAFILLYGALYAYSGEFLREKFEADADVIGILLSTSSISTAIFASKARWIAERVSPLKIFTLSLVLQGIALGFIFIIPRIEYFLIVTFFFGAGHGLAVPILQSEIARQAPHERRGIVMSLLSSVIRTGQSLGPLLFGLLLTRFSLSQAFAMMAGITLFICFLLLLISPRAHREQLLEISSPLVGIE
ncbi:MAG: MFS transporter [Candidatus Hodarchaeota archaeon]